MSSDFNSRRLNQKTTWPKVRVLCAKTSNQVHDRRANGVPCSGMLDFIDVCRPFARHAVIGKQHAYTVCWILLPCVIKSSFPSSSFNFNCFSRKSELYHESCWFVRSLARITCSASLSRTRQCSKKLSYEILPLISPAVFQSPKNVAQRSTFLDCKVSSTYLRSTAVFNKTRYRTCFYLETAITVVSNMAHQPNSRGYNVYKLLMIGDAGKSSCRNFPRDCFQTEGKSITGTSLSYCVRLLVFGRAVTVGFTFLKVSVNCEHL